MSEMIERVARAVETYGIAYSHVNRKWAVHRITDHAPTEADIVESFPEKAPAHALARRLNARAAIEAMREITDEMQDAALCVLENQSNAPDRPLPTLRNAWRAMIDSALKEGVG